MVAVALIGLNLGAVAASLSHYPRKQLLEFGIGNGRGATFYRADGTVLHYRGNAEMGYRLTRVERRPPPPTLLQIWTPVLASAGFTLLTLIALVPRREIRDRRPPPD